MTSRRTLSTLLSALTISVFTGCGGSADGGGTGPNGGPSQTASAVATPSSATMARGGSANTTIVFSATGGLTLGGGLTINKPLEGITVNAVSTSGSSPTITELYSVGANASVPPGTYKVYFSKPLSGFTGSGPASSAATATFTLTVTP